MTTEIYRLEMLEREPQGLRARVSYDAAHPVFAGHFPENPIVPGVCTLNMITDILQEAVSGVVSLLRAPNVKFLQLIRPQDQPELRMSWTVSGAEVDLQASLQAEDVVLMRFSGKYVRTESL